MLNKRDLVIEIEAVIATLCQLVEHFGKSIKLPIEGETEAEYQEAKAMFDQHLKFLGAVGLVNEYTVNEHNVSVTISPHILGFYSEFFKEIEMIAKGMNSYSDTSDDNTLRAFKRMFPQDREHCSRCCPVDIEELEIENE
jgi:hypothetical protein